MIDQTAPYLLILTAYVFATVVCLLFFVRSTVLSDSKLTAFGLALLWSAICLIPQIVLLGLPHHWNALSLAGKLLAQIIGNFIVFAAAGWTMSFAKEREVNTRRRAIAGFSFGLLAIVPSVIAVLFLSCAFTNDCI
jgi:apolipoprotein N-acyltransferase